MNLSSDCEDKLKIYRDNFEKAYLDATQAFYRAKAPQYLDANGVQNYMRYADQKLKEEEQRASRYLETRRDSKSVEVVCVLFVLSITTWKDYKTDQHFMGCEAHLAWKCLLTLSFLAADFDL